MNSEVKKTTDETLRQHNHTTELVVVGCLVSILLFIGTPLFSKVFPSASAGQSLQVIREGDLKPRS